ncbi:MAG: ABC transporter ATP-binding protein [Bacteroidota bacterium]
MASRRRGQAPSDENAPPKRKLNSEGLKKLKKLLAYVRPYRWKFILGLVFLALSTATTLAFPMFFGELLNIALGESSLPFFDNMNQVAIALGALLVIQAVFSFFRVLLFVEVAQKSLADLRKALYGNLIRLPMAFFNRSRVGELSSRISADISQIQDTFTLTFAELTRGIVTLIVGVIIIFIISTKLTLLMLGTFPVLMIAAIFFGRFIRKLSKAAQDSLANANVVVEESLQGIQNVKAFTNEQYETNRFRRSIDEVVSIAMKGARWRGAFSSFIILAIFGAIVVIMWYGSQLVQSGEIAAGDLAAFLFYTGLVGGSIGGFGEHYSQLQKTIGATERVFELLEEVREPDKVTEAAEVVGTVEYRDLVFNYPSRPDVEVIRGLSFKVNAGEKVALVGGSGAGKSTIVALLLRFYDPQSGQILIDGKPLSDYSLAAIRKRMAFVPQDVFLFGGSIKENIAYGNLDADDEAIMTAARRANAHDFISEFPDGYDTVVGERGIQLSGGQRQRIAIARALLRDPRILILDEATSALDSESEQLVQAALEELMKGRTSFIIAHRLATIRNVDRILVIKDGQLVEEGTHDELIQHPDGYYKMLAELQFTADSEAAV